MTIEIRDKNFRVSLEVPEETKGHSFSESVLISALRAVEHAFPGMDMIRTYCHVDPDTHGVRDDNEPIWQAYKRYNLCYHYHLKVTEDEQM